MRNPYVVERLDGLLASLRAAHQSTRLSASAAKGSGRADFVREFLSEVMPQAYRIKTSAEITDSFGLKSGEIDIVLENNFFFSLPLLNAQHSRLHFAEGVGAAIEVKSNLQGQWDEVIRTGNMVKALNRRYQGGNFGTSAGPTITMIPNMRVSPKNSLGPLPDHPSDNIRKKVPFFVVGYEGWTKQESLIQKLQAASGVVDGILQINPAYYVSAPTFSNLQASGSLSLFGLIYSIHESFSYVRTAISDLLDYAR